MNDARDRLLSSPIYSDAVIRLIGKLLVPDHLTSNEHKECLAKMTTLFFDEHQLGRMTLLLPVDGTILGHYQEPRYLASWLAWFYRKF